METLQSCRARKRPPERPVLAAWTAPRSSSAQRGKGPTLLLASSCYWGVPGAAPRPHGHHQSLQRPLQPLSMASPSAQRQGPLNRSPRREIMTQGILIVSRALSVLWDREESSVMMAPQPPSFCLCNWNSASGLGCR